MRTLAIVSWATLIVATGCLDLRDFNGAWTGVRVGDAPALRVGFGDEVTAVLVIERAALRGLQARLTTNDDVFVDAVIQPIPGAEADVLAGVTFDGAPSRVYLSFVTAADGGGPALVVVAMYDDARIELRVLRGGSVPLYGIFSLKRS